MSQVYSTSFFAVADFIGTELVPVPAGYRMIVRDVDAIDNSTEGGAEVVVAFQPPEGVDVAFFAAETPTEGPPRELQWRGRQVCPDGWSLSVSAAGPMDVCVSGYLLGLP